MIVRLSPEAMLAGEVYAAERRRLNKSMGLEDAHKAPADRIVPWEVQGVQAEIAVWSYYRHVAVYTPVVYGVHPSSIPYDMMIGDLEVDVKSVDGAHCGLIAHEAQPETQINILVNAENAPVFDIVGWSMVADIRQPEFWRDDWRSPTWCKPRMLLNAMEDLRLA